MEIASLIISDEMMSLQNQRGRLHLLSDHIREQWKGAKCFVNIPTGHFILDLESLVSIPQSKSSKYSTLM
jgi:hypothetical protein